MCWREQKPSLLRILHSSQNVKQKWKWNKSESETKVEVKQKWKWNKSGSETEVKVKQKWKWNKSEIILKVNEPFSTPQIRSSATLSGGNNPDVSDINIVSWEK